MMKIKNINNDTLNDIVDVVFSDNLKGHRIYGQEEEPGVIIFRDIDSDELRSISLLYFSTYPNVWRESLIKLKLNYIADELSTYYS